MLSLLKSIIDGLLVSAISKPPQATDTRAYRRPHAGVAREGTDQGTARGTAQRTRRRALLGIGHSRAASEYQHREDDHR